MTGSRNQAGAGELNFLVGGSSEMVERARPVLTVMAKSITHLGPTGSGALVKLINNFVCGTQVASFAEALAMVERSALDRDRTVSFLIGGAMGSPIVKTMAERMLAGDFTTNFALKLLAKDLDYAIEEGRKLDVRLTTAGRRGTCSSARSARATETRTWLRRFNRCDRIDTKMLAHTRRVLIKSRVGDARTRATDDAR